MKKRNINKTIFILLCGLFFAIPLAYSQTAESDKLFGQGVEAYRKKQYYEAIAFFNQCHEIDKKTLGEEHTRSQYSNIWNACCYYKLGYVDKAKELSPAYYNITPIDRRLTAESDSISDIANGYMNNGEFEKALPYLQKTAQIEEKEIGKDNAWYAGTLAGLALILNNLERYDEAIEMITEAIDIIIKDSGEKESALLSSMYAQKVDILYFSGKDINEALRLAENIYRYSVENFGKESNQTYEATLALANCHFALDMLPEALEEFSVLKRVYEQFQMQDDPSYDVVLLHIAEIRNNLFHEFIESKDILLEVKKNFEQKGWAESTYYARCITDIATIYNALGDFKNSGEYAEKGIEVFRKSRLPHESTYANLLLDLYYSYGYAQESEKATAAIEEACEIFDKQSIHNFNAVNAYSAIASDLLAKNQYKRAMDYAKKAYAELDFIPEVDDSVRMMCIGRLAISYYYNNEIDSAYTYAEQVVANIDKSFTPDSYFAAQMLSELAGIYSVKKDFSQAIELLKKSCSIVKKNAPESLSYAQYLYTLAFAYYQNNQFVNAIETQREVVTLFEQLEGMESMTFKNALVDYLKFSSELDEENIYANLPERYKNIVLEAYADIDSNDIPKLINNAKYMLVVFHDAENALKQIQKVHELYEKLEDKTPIDAINILFMEAELHNNIQQYEMAIECVNKAEVLLNEYKNYFKNDFIYINPTFQKCIASFNLKQYDNSREYAKKLIEYSQKLFGKENLYSIVGYVYVAVCSYKLGDIEETRKTESELYETVSDYILHQFSTMSSSERTDFWNRLSVVLTNVMPMLAYNTNDAEITSNAYNAMLLSKGLLLNTDKEMSAIILESGNTETLGVFNQLTEKRKELTELLQQPDKGNTDQINIVNKKIKELERDLSSASTLYGDYTKNLRISWQDVQAKLGNNDTAIEFSNFYSEDTLTFVAFVLTKKMQQPEMVKLFNINDYNEISKDELYTTDKLYQLVWKPLEKYMSTKGNTYFSPSGLIYSTAIESVPMPDKKIIGNKYPIYRLSSSREITIKHNKKSSKKVALYGGIEYHALSDEIITANEENGIKRSGDDLILNIGKLLENTDSTLLRRGIAELPGTMREVENIHSILEKEQYESMMYTKAGGSEDSFKNLSGKNINMIHIATHGFYLSIEDAQKLQKLNFLQMANQGMSREDKMLTMSGLFMAGASYSLNGNNKSKMINDGILTAAEIAKLDFRDIDMVVLSACETGIGEINGEGVFGLQRGFKKAGAQTLVMSLWKVDDTVTQIFMTEFYRQLVTGKGKSKREAFTNAQQYLKTTEKGKYDSPEFWAAFILLDAI